MIVAHLLVGVLAGVVAGAWGWVAGLPVWALVCLYAFEGSLGAVTSAAVLSLRSRRVPTARKAEGAAQRARSTGEGSKCDGKPIRVPAAEQRRHSPKQHPRDR